MAQLLHGSATTTARTRAEFQGSEESVAELARRYCVNPKTVAKWRKRDCVDDSPMGPRERKSTTLSPLEEAAIVAFRVQTRLPLDDVFVALKPSIPALTRSTLHRCLQRHGVSRLPRPARERRGRFKSYEIGYFHIDVCEVRVEQGKAYLFVAVDRTSKFSFARLYRRATTLTAAAFLKVLLKAVPYRIHTILTDNGIQFSNSADPRRYKYEKSHAFERVCRAHRIEHRLTKPYHPWTNGQAERMVRTLKEATVRAYHYETYRQLRRHVADYLAAYNFAEHLKALRWKTPYETIQALWESKPDLFRDSPDHLIPGPNTSPPGDETPQEPTTVSAPPAPADSEADPAFDALLPTLSQTTSAPIMLPADLPEELQNVAVDANEGGEGYRVLSLYRPTGNVVEDYVHANDVGTLTAVPEPPDMAYEYFQKTSEEAVELTDGTEATLRYMEPREGMMGNQGPFWEGYFKRDGYTYTLNVPSQDPSGDVARSALTSMVEVPGSSDSGTEDPEAEAEAAAGEYYRAAGVEDWGYTYENLDSETQALFTRDEWFQKNQWFADNGEVVYHIDSVERVGTGSGVVVEVSLRLTYEDGTSSTRVTYFVLEDGEWKHAFGQEERDLFMPEASFEEFVAAQQ